MGRFYFYFQWLGIILVPLLVTVGLTLMGDEFLLHPYQIVLGISLAVMLSLTASYTSRSQITSKKTLSKRVTGLLEPVYATSIALLFTGGSTDPNSENISPVVAVLTSRGVDMTDALTVNGFAQAFLMTALFLFALTSLLVAFRERLAQKEKHYTAERYDIVYDVALSPEEEASFEANTKNNPTNLPPLDDLLETPEK